MDVSEGFAIILQPLSAYAVAQSCAVLPLLSLSARKTIKTQRVLAQKHSFCRDYLSG